MVQVDQGVKLEEGKPFVEILLASLKVDPVYNLPYQLLAPCCPALLWERIRCQMLPIEKDKSTIGYNPDGEILHRDKDSSPLDR